MLVTLMLLVSALEAYLLGSVNGAIIISRFLYGQDIRRSGSGNAGLTNFYRTYGVTGTAGVIAIDVIKGVLGAFLGGLLVGLAAPEGMEIGITTWPSNDIQKSNYLKPAMFFSISVDSEHPDEAAEVINYWTNSVECNEILLGERGVPVASNVAEAITPLMSEAEQTVVSFINDVVTPQCSDVSPASPNGATEVYDVVYKLEEAICYGEMTAAEAADQLLTEGNEILSNKQ